MLICRNAEGVHGKKTVGNPCTRISLQIFLKIGIKSWLALYWSSFLVLLWLIMLFEVVHFGYSCATVCILIHWHLPAPIRKSFPIHSCTVLTTRIIRSLLLLDPWNLTNIRTLRRSNLAFISKSLQRSCRKHGLVNIFQQRKLFNRKEAKGPNKLFRANQLETRPEKNHMKFFRPTNLE